jgi:ribonuclease-3
LAAAKGLGVPEYRVSEEGPDHAKTFTAAVVFSGVVHGDGSGRTKKEAEQQAAAGAYRKLREAEPQPVTTAATAVELKSTAPTVADA